jgi:predicted MFS family arabinose efflux permease
MHIADRATPFTDVATPADRDWPTVVACGLCLMLSVGTLLVYSFGVFVRPLVAQFHWTRTQVSGGLSIGQFTVALSAPFWGWLIDRFGPRRVILPSIVGLSIAFASLSLLTPHVWHLYLLFALFSLFGGGSSPIGYSAVLVRGFNRHLGLALGLSLMGIGFGATLLPSLAQFFVSHFGWRTAYAAIGILTLIITVPAGIFATRNARRPLPARTREKVAIAPMLRTRAFLLMIGIFLLLAIASGGAFANIVPMMVDRGNAPATAARIAGLAGIAVIAGRGGIGWLLDRFNAARILACVCLAVVASLLLLIYAHGRLPDALAALLLGSVLGAEVDFTAFLVRRYFGNAAFSRLYGIAFGIFALGIGLGPLLMGQSFDRTGGYNPGLFLFIAMALIAALTTFAMPRYNMPTPH